VIRSEEEVGPFTALQYRNSLRDELVCSDSWVLALVPKVGGERWALRLHLYPPGGDQTAMRECRICHRVCPPNGTGGSPFYRLAGVRSVWGEGGRVRAISTMNSVFDIQSYRTLLDLAPKQAAGAFPVGAGFPKRVHLNQRQRWALLHIALFGRLRRANLGKKHCIPGDIARQDLSELVGLGLLESVSVEPSLCCDCEVEKSEQVFAKRAHTPEPLDLKDDLHRRWWPKAISWSGFGDRTMAGLLGSGVLAGDAPDPSVSAGVSPMLLRAFEGSALELEDVDAAPKRRTHTHREQVEKAIERLNSGKRVFEKCPTCHLYLRRSERREYTEERKNCPECGALLRAPQRLSDRAPGCQIALLTATEKGLQREIDYFRKRWKHMSKSERQSYPWHAVVGRAKRVNRPS